MGETSSPDKYSHDLFVIGFELSSNHFEFHVGHKTIVFFKFKPLFG